MANKRVILIAAALFALLGLVAMGAAHWIRASAPWDSGTELVGGPFTLVDQDGRTVNSESFKGAPFLVFFGYTHCPDVCPTTLADMSQMLTALGKDKPVRAAFVTVDPERDTPAVLKEYLSSFDPRITGLTGSPEAIAAAEKSYRVYARKVPTQGSDYSMDHTAIVYLMDREGHFVQAFNLQQPPDKAAAEVAAYL